MGEPDVPNGQSSVFPLKEEPGKLVPIERAKDIRDKTNLVLDEKLDTLDGGSSSLGDCCGDASHKEVDHEVLMREVILAKWPSCEVEASLSGESPGNPLH